MEAKTILFLSALIATSSAVKDFPQKNFIGVANVIPREEVPGFWNNREAQKINFQCEFRHKYDRESRIVGGSEAVPHSHPYQVGLLMVIQWWTGLCGGSLLSDNIVITAAHCPEGSVGLTVVLGAHFLFNSFESTQVRVGVYPSNYIYHPEYNPSMFYNDIALILLPTRVKFNVQIQPIALPYGELLRKDFADVDAVVSGWGRDSDNHGAVSEFLQYTQNKVMDNPDCYEYFGNFVIDTTLCLNTKNTNSGTCNGDSGGPLTIFYHDKVILIGVVSWGALSGCELGLPTGLARVTHFEPWIIRYLRLHS